MLVRSLALASIVLVIFALGSALPVAAADDWQAGNLVANGSFAKGRPGEADFKALDNLAETIAGKHRGLARSS